MGVDEQSRDTILIREFRVEEDTAQVAEIFRESTEATPWSEKDLRRMRELSGVSALVSVENGRISGVVITRRVLDEAEILNLAVRRESRCRGEGKKLVGTLLNEYVGEGITRVFLEVRESNEGAIGFYEYLGFRTVGERKDYYQEPREAALVMELRLRKSTESGE